MRKLCFLSAVLCCATGFAQMAVRVGAGATISSMTLRQTWDLLDDKIVTYNASVSMDYLQRKYFYLSSEFKYLQFGGDDHELIALEQQDMT